MFPTISVTHCQNPFEYIKIINSKMELPAKEEPRTELCIESVIACD